MHPLADGHTGPRPSLTNAPMTDSLTPETVTELAPETAPATPEHARQDRPNRTGRPDRRNGKPSAPSTSSAPRGRKVHPVLEKLFALYPNIFGAHFLPLKLGTFQDLMAAHPDAFERDDLKVALGLHARSTRYLESVASGLQRHDLQGNPVEPVAPEHVHHAILEIFKRRQARSAEDLRPYVRAQLVEAFEASGLDREAYAELVRKQDEAANTLLDEAFAEWGAKLARHEALLRAFEASGSTLEQFADMYGMDPRQAGQMLERARHQRPPAATA